MPKADDLGGLSGRFDKVADDVPQILWSVDAGGTHDFINRQLKEFVGERINTINADNWTSLIHPDDRDRVEKLSRTVFSTTTPYELEYRLLHHSGEYRWLRRNSTRTAASSDGTAPPSISIRKSSSTWKGNWWPGSLITASRTFSHWSMG
jgi:PAS domain S-box-containing protein